MVDGQVYTVPTPLGIRFEGTGSSGLYVVKVNPDSNALKSNVMVGARIMSIGGAYLCAVCARGVVHKCGRCLLRAYER